MKELRKEASAPGGGFEFVPISRLSSNPGQPRQHWDSKDPDGGDAIAGLAKSIKAEGILQPLVVTPRDGKLLIVCGERRYRAAKQAGLDAVPVIVRPGLSEREVLELSITENLQREDLTPVDEARAIQALIKLNGLKQADIARRLGLSIPAINYKLSLLRLSPDLQGDISKGNLTATQGREIAQAVGASSDEERSKAMAKIKTSVDQHRRLTGRNLSAKDVKAIARAVVKSRSQRRTRKAASKFSAEDRVHAREFLMLLSKSIKAVALFVGGGKKAIQAALALTAVDGKAIRQINNLQALFARLKKVLEKARKASKS